MSANQSEDEITVKHIRRYSFLTAIGVNRKKRGCVLGIIPNRAAPFNSD